MKKINRLIELAGIYYRYYAYHLLEKWWDFRNRMGWPAAYCHICGKGLGGNDHMNGPGDICWDCSDEKRFNTYDD